MISVFPTSMKRWLAPAVAISRHRSAPHAVELSESTWKFTADTLQGMFLKERYQDVRRLLARAVESTNGGKAARAKPWRNSNWRESNGSSSTKTLRNSNLPSKGGRGSSKRNKIGPRR